MADAIAGFFERLDERGHVPTLKRLTGTLRVELQRAGEVERWFVTVDQGDVSVSHRNAKADCIVRTEREHFVAMTEGRLNPLAAVLRGLVGIEGDLSILVLFQRVFPGPPRSRRRREPASEARA
jgi:putative sterol carrier protein